MKERQKRERGVYADWLRAKALTERAKARVERACKAQELAAEKLEAAEVDHRTAMIAETEAWAAVEATRETEEDGDE